MLTKVNCGCHKVRCIKFKKAIDGCPQLLSIAIRPLVQLKCAVKFSNFIGKNDFIPIVEMIKLGMCHIVLLFKYFIVTQYGMFVRLENIVKFIRVKNLCCKLNNYCIILNGNLHIY